LSLLVEGIINSKSSNLKEIANHVDSDVSVDSVYRRFQRFFEKEMDLTGIGLYCLDTFLQMLTKNIDEPISIYLIIDRCHWKYGEKDNNLLVLHVYEPLTGIDFPIKAIDLCRPGNSSYSDREYILRNILSYIEPYIESGSVNVSVLGDREFNGKSWEDYLKLNNMSYILRIKRDYYLPDGRQIVDIYNDLRTGEVVDLRCDGWRVIVKKLEEIKGRRDSCLAVVTLNMDAEAEEVLREYGLRWGIERGFFNLNTNGFELKTTHLTNPFRIEMMFYILSFCYFLSVICGYIISRIKRITIKKHGYKCISRFLSGLRAIVRLRYQKMVDDMVLAFKQFMLLDLLNSFNLIKKDLVNRLVALGVV
jgi:hypothetical protein